MKYKLLGAERREASNGNEFIFATYSEANADALLGNLAAPRTLAIFPVPGTEDAFFAAWDEQIEHPTQVINAKNFSVEVEPHVKFYTRGENAGKPITNSDDKPIVFTTINVFSPVNEDDEPSINIESAAKRIFKRSCKTVEEIKAAKAAKKAQEAAAKNQLAGKVDVVDDDLGL